MMKGSKTDFDGGEFTNFGVYFSAFNCTKKKEKNSDMEGRQREENSSMRI